jgi:prepilin-type N-terminal cleavage/methylation domain-containing protein
MSRHLTVNSAPSRPRGFTLLEVMVALAIGGIALSSIYAIGSASTKHFREQQRISTTQSSLRNAMDQLKRDFQRAGFLATPNILVAGEACLPVPTAPINDPTTGRLAAVSALFKNVAPPPSLDPEHLNIKPTSDFDLALVDKVVLMGNYATSGEYTGITIGADSKTITIPTNWQSFQRDFAEWSGLNAGQCNLPAFSSAFTVGRLVRIHTLSEHQFFSTIDSITCSGTTATVTLTTTIPPTCNATGGWIAPVNTMRYQVEDTSGTEQTLNSTTNRVAVLRRTEVQPGAKTAILTKPGTTVPVDDRAILDYVVRFTVDFMVTTGAAIAANDLVAAPPATVMAQPERVRGVILELAARTSEQESQFLNAVSGHAFRVSSTSLGAARVRSMHAELLLPNIAFRGF